jgi:hypothetical protein
VDEWQVLLVKAQPQQFLRGLIHSDGKSVPEHGDGQGPTLRVPTLFLHQQVS